MLHRLASTIVSDKIDPPLQSPDYQVALVIAHRAAELTKEQDVNILATLAYAYFKSGDVRSALRYQKAAIDLAENDPSVSDRQKQELRKRYEQFQRAAQQNP